MKATSVPGIAGAFLFEPTPPSARAPAKQSSCAARSADYPVAASTHTHVSARQESSLTRRGEETFTMAKRVRQLQLAGESKARS